MRPKKRISSKLFGPELLSGKRIAPANLPGDVGGETQKADIHQVVCPEKNGPLRSRHVSKLTVSTWKVHDYSHLKRYQTHLSGIPVRKWVSAANVPGGAGGAAQNSGRAKSFVTPISGNTLHRNCGVYQLCPGVPWCDPKRGLVTKLDQDFWVGKRGPENR